MEIVNIESTTSFCMEKLFASPRKLQWADKEGAHHDAAQHCIRRQVQHSSIVTQSYVTQPHMMTARFH